MLCYDFCTIMMSYFKIFEFLKNVVIIEFLKMRQLYCNMKKFVRNEIVFFEFISM